MQQVSVGVSEIIAVASNCYGVKCVMITFFEEGTSYRVIHGIAYALQVGKEAQSSSSLPMPEQLSQTSPNKHGRLGDEGLMAAATGWH